MAQYRRAAQSRGYKPRQVDQGNIQRMREESDRTARNMRERAEMEVSDRRRSLAQQKEDQAATRRMEEKNYQISTDNSRREIEGLRLKAQQESRQASLDIEASNTIFQSIAKFSATAMDAAFEIEKKKTAQKYNDDVNRARENDYDSLGIYIADAAATSLEQQTAVNAAEATGGADPLVAAKIKNRDPNQQLRAGLATIDAALRDGVLRDYLLDGVNRRQEAAGGRPLEYEDKRDAILDMHRAIRANFKDSGYPPDIVANVEARLEQQISKILGTFRTEQTKIEDNQSRSTNISIFENSSGENLLIQFPAIWSKIQDLNDYDAAESWKDLTPSMTAVDQRTGNPIMDMAVIDQLPLVINGKDTTFGEHFTNSKGQAVGIRAKIIEDRNRNQLNWETTNDRIEEEAAETLEEELVRAVSANPTTANIGEAQRKYVEATGGKASAKLNNFSKYASIEVGLRNNEAQRILSKPDDQLTQVDVDAASAVMTTEQAATVKQRYEANVGQYHTKEASKIIKNATTTITGTTAFGPKTASPGAQVAISYMEGQIRKKAKLIYGNGQNGFTVEEALTKAADDESAIYLQQLTTGRHDTLPYARKTLPNGRIEFPYLEKRAGDVSAAEKAVRDYQVLRTQVKSLGLQEVINIPNSFIPPERMDYIAENYGKPGFQPAPLERAFQGMAANGTSLDQIYNAAFKAAGRTERFEPPQVLKGVTFTTEQQRIINDAAASYQSKLNVINVASGNTEVYKSPVHVRAGSPFLVYMSGNIGPTSTGPHLDVKRVDGQEFAPNALDTFIEVEDPELGRVPLSKVPITGDFAEHKARGSHGIDYGLYSGTQVFAKNGAKVVDTQPSEHGDVVTIELPNGLRYTFLHGTAPK
jgi:hypothetical protein